MLKIKAFTFIEMMIGISLIVIILAFVFNALLKSKSLISKIDNKLLMRNEIENFLFAFQNDVFKSSHHEMNPNEITFKHHDKQIRYTFTQDYIFRYGIKTDSFKLGDAELISSTNDEINYSIQLQFPFHQKIQRFYFYKNYSCADLMENNKSRK